MSLDNPIPLRKDEDGIVRIGKSRVTLDTVVFAFKDGATPEGIVDSYPSLSLADVYLVLGYYLLHQTEVEAYLLEGQERSEDVRKANEARWDPTGIRARLLGRRAAKN